MPEPYILVAIGAVFLLAGTVKGVVGFGLPSISLGLLLVVLKLPDAIALMLFPSLVTNLWQAFRGSHGREVLLRIWPFLLMANSTVVLGVMVLTRVNLSILSGFLGLLMMAYAVLSLLKFQMVIREKNNLAAGLFIGFFNGIVTGMTGSYLVPGIIYLQGIGLSKDQLVQAMGMLFCSLTVTLMIALQGNELLSFELGLLSLMAIVPTFIGLLIGQSLRNLLSEALFRLVVLFAILLLGSYIFGNALIS